ncbi:DUF262 domain-containing protein [Epibacterium ulvae]|uniref:DUF262 domain-containing protein n=1 Tax=Epibacterium ulvae TaxID=1156985 RepID=UPI0024937135|nr:DUF262 domain-containing protein [Epibacterium ulvae]
MSLEQKVKIRMNEKKAQLEIKEQRRSVGFDSYDITIKQLVDMVAEKAINIAPSYQRHFVWDAKRQSQLIESFLLGIPVPSLFMATNEDSTWEVIDGLQRLTTLLNFTYPLDQNGNAAGEVNELRLSGLEKIPSLNGVYFREFSTSMKLNFMTRPVRITVLNDLSDHQVRFDLFERLNTGGIVLHEQEIRNCVFQGRFNDLVKECAEDERLTKAFKRRDRSTRGNLEEQILKFFAYYESRENFVHSVRGFLNDYMEEKTKKFSNENSLRSLFDKTLAVIDQELPGGVVRQDRPNTTPLALFECVMVAVADLISEGTEINGEALRTVLDDKDLKVLMTGATNSKPRLLGRINLVKQNIAA